MVNPRSHEVNKAMTADISEAVPVPFSPILDNRGLALPLASRPLPAGPVHNRWALLIGVNHYIDPGIPDLKFCVNDVMELKVALEALGYTVVILHDEVGEERLLPTRDNIEAELARICQVAEPDDQLWIHFAGHGVLEGGKPLLLSREVRTTTLAKKALPLTLLEEVMRDSKARRLMLTLDACHTGVETGRALTDPEFIRNAYELAEGFALMAASTAQQYSQEWHEKKHGIFTYYLLEVLRDPIVRAGKGFVTVSDLTVHVLDRLRKWNVQQGGRIQEPTARVEGLGDVIVADYRGRTLVHAVTRNPFQSGGRITSPAEFVGRENLLRELFEALEQGSNRSLVGEAQVGKSSILSMVYAQGPQRIGLPIAAFIYLDMQLIHGEQDFFDALCDEMGIETCRGYKLFRQLRGKRYVLCLDEIEKMRKTSFSGEEREQLRGLADGADAPFTLVVASRMPLDELFPDTLGSTSPLANICQQLTVLPFTNDEARRFIAQRLKDTGVTFSPMQVDAIIEESAGHPARLQQVAATLYSRLIHAAE